MIFLLSFVATIAVVSAADIPAVQVVPSTGNQTVIIVQPKLLTADSSVPSTTVCKVRENLMPAGSKCVVTDCAPRFRKIECNNASVSDLNSTFATYVENAGNDAGSSLPLAVRLSGLSGSFNRGTLAPVAGRIKSLELVNTNIDRFGNDTFDDLYNVTHMDLNGVQNDMIPSGAFDSFKNLQILQIRNMPNLKAIEQGALMPLFKRNQTVCMNLNIANENFVCDCNNNVWIQSTLTKQQRKISTENQPLYYSSNDTATIPCGIDITCSSKSPEGFRQKLMDIALNVTCSANTTTVAPAKQNNDAVTTSIVKPGNAADGMSPNGLWLTSLLAVFCGLLAMA